MREIELPLGGRNVRLPLGSAGIRAGLDAVRSHLLPLRVAEIERALDAVPGQWQVGSAAPPDAGTLTAEDLRQLAASDTATIGPHTAGPFLDRSLPPPEARGHGLGTAAIHQSSDATMETWLSDAAPRELAGSR